MSIDLDSTVFEFNEDSIMKESSSKKSIEINNNSDGDLDKSATLDELLAECDDEEEERKEITIQTVMQQLSMIDDDDDDSDSTLTDSTLMNTDFGDTTESSYLSEQEF